MSTARVNVDMQINQRESFSDSVYEQQTRLAERELFSFIEAVTQTYGPEQARLSADDWIEEAGFSDGPFRSEVRDWRSVTIAASARLASRISELATLASGRSLQ